MKKILSFIKEAKAELKRVTWPGRQQVWYSTLIVIAFTLIVAAYLGIVDLALTGVFSRLI